MLDFDANHHTQLLKDISHGGGDYRLAPQQFLPVCSLEVCAQLRLLHRRKTDRSGCLGSNLTTIAVVIGRQGRCEELKARTRRPAKERRKSFQFFNREYSRIDFCNFALELILVFGEEVERLFWRTSMLAFAITGDTGFLRPLRCIGHCGELRLEAFHLPVDI